MNPEYLRKIREKTKEVLAHCEEVSCRLDAMKNPLQIGDVLLIAGYPDDAFVYFACVSAHFDDKDMFFFVPIDDVNFMIGISDVQAKDNFFFNGWVARCGFGFLV